MNPSLDAEIEHRLLSITTAPALEKEFARRLRDHGIMFGAEPLPTFLRPHLLPPSGERWLADAEAMFALLERVVVRVLDSPEICSWLGFEGRALDLLRLDPGYRRSIIVGRPDALPCGDDVSFVEFNTDSPAMMTMADEIQDAMLDLPPLADLREHLKCDMRVPALLEALLEAYREYGGRLSPTIAIVDWPGEKTYHEQKRTAALFTKLGCPTEFAAPNALRYDGHRLFADGRPIDLVYRRVLFRDFVRRAEELAPLLDAYRAGHVCMANPLRSYVAGTKALLALMHDPENPLSLLAEDRQLVERVVPATHVAVPGATIDRENWVLKKAESYGGKDVVVGPFVDDAEWTRALESVKESTWVRQAFEAPPKFSVPVVSGERYRLVEKFMNWNPFVFGGRHGGGITRVSESFLVSITRGGGLLPTLRVAR